MIEKKLTIVNASGLHARPAAEFVGACAKFKSKIMIKKNKEGAKNVNAKSMVMLLSQAFSKGDEVIISVDGEDEKECLNKLEELINSGFGE